MLKFTLSYADAASIVWVRMSVAAFLFAFMLSKKNLKNLKFIARAPFIVYVAALALAFNFIGYMKCIDLTTASNAQVMIQIGPLLLALSGILYFKEKPSKAQWVGMCLALTGFVVFYQDQLQMAWHNKANYVDGNMWILAAAATWAYFTFIQKYLAKNIQPKKMLYVIFFIASMVLIPLVDFKLLSNLAWTQWLLLIFLGVNSWLAYWFLGEALKRAPASHVSLIITLNPLVTIMTIQLLTEMNWLFIPNEPMNLFSYLGTGLVVLGVGTTISSQNLKPVKPILEEKISK